MKGFLPANAELHRRHVSDDSLCQMCGNGDESLFHAMVGCEEARRFFGAKIPRMNPLTWTREMLDPQFILLAKMLLLLSLSQ